MKKILLVLILVLAGFLRFWNLGAVPPTASMDEASIGYNAYSVAKIGVDEYGVFPLISQRAYDDWRRSTYLLLVVPFVALLNLQVAAVRLPAAILSVITVWAVYRIVRLLFIKQSAQADGAGLLASFLLALSPWHIYISRLGHESNAYLSFFVLGSLFFLEGIKNKHTLFIALLFFALSLVSYYAGQVIVPLFGLGLIFVYRKTLYSVIVSDRKMFALTCIAFVLFIPVLWSVFSPSALIRFSGTSTFKPEAHGEEFTKLVLARNAAVEKRDIIGAIINDRRLFPVRVFVEGYVSHFQFDWLFKNSGTESFKVPHLGLLYFWEAPFIAIGLWAFFRHRDLDIRAKKMISLWFLLAPFPAAVATQAPHAMRSYAFLPTWQIFAALGLIHVYILFKRFKFITVSAFIVFITMSLQSFWQNYYFVFPKEQSQSFLYALSKAIPYAVAREDKYGNIVFSNSDQTYQSYMMYLYYTRFNPSLYQRLGGTKSGGYAETHYIGKYDFRPIIWKQEKPTSRTLYIGNVKDFPDNAVVAATFYLLDGSPALSAVSVEP